MRIQFSVLAFVLPFLCTIASAQTYQSAEADRLISGSKTVRIDPIGKIDYVELQEAAQYPASKFPNWAKKAFELDEKISFEKVRDENDKFGFQHSRYNLSYQGVLVFGAFAYTHGSNDHVRSFNGSFPSNIVAGVNSISEQTALENAKTHIGADQYKWELPEEEEHLKWESGNPDATYFPKGELVYIDPSFTFSKVDGFRLAYKFDIYAHWPIYRAEVFVDAQTGEVLFENHRIHIADAVGTAQTGYSGTKTIITDSFGGGFRLREAGRGNGIRTFDMNTGTTYGNAVDFTDANNNWNNANAQLDQYATDAHWGAEMTYDYFLNEHGRNGIDGANMQINSYVHYDDGYFNAFWDGQRMTYGDGNGNPLTALDICGHEMTHGVTDFSANLVYQNESGALNESFSDIFGASVEFIANPSSGDWLVGEDVGTFRSMSNPNAYGDPDTYQGTNWVTGTADNGGVHTNSGVQNKWFYILVEGESGTNDIGDSYNVTGIGLDDAAAIAYRNLTVYLGINSDYADARFYSIQAAIDLFGGCSPQVIACTNAWYAVGVGDPFDATVISDFNAALTTSCEVPFSADFVNLSSNGASYLWNFGDGGTSTAVNPSHTYSSNGTYSVTLYVDGDNCGADTVVFPNYISVNPTNPCVALMPANGNQTLTWCTGTLYDDGGPAGNYQDDEDVVTTISPPGATSVTLNFSDFGFEQAYDYMYVYDGPTTNSPLIGQYDGFNLPNGGTIASSGGSITIRQSSDIFVNESGFALTWECTQPNAAPSPLFTGSPRTTCSGEVSFSDQSINGATSWMWDFGDGNTSTAQNPTHTYADEGIYTVTLTASNGFGSNVVSQNNYVVVDRPPGPAAVGDFSCDAASLSLSATGDGQLSWYDQASGGSLVATGSVFNTPNLSSSTTYYVEYIVAATTYNIGPPDNSFGGGGNFEGDQYLIFDCLEAFTLNTVKVYAQGTGNRTIELRNSAGTVLQSLTVNIPNGLQTVTLNFSIQPGTGYQLGTTPDPDLYRNNDGPSYPYAVSNVVSITTSSTGNDYYYFFYDWEIETLGCTSERTAVVAEITEAPTAQNASRCGTGSVSLSANGSGDLNWYDAASGGNLVHTGSSFNTPLLSTTTSYFVETEVLPAPLYGGAVDNNFGTGSEFNNIQSLVFDCYEASTLVSVKVYAFGAGNRTVELRNAGGTVIQSATINIPDGESRITLNFDLPIGTDLQLGTSAAAALYRNNSGPSYPYDIPGVLSITTSTAGTGFYYYFYDWEVQREGCTTDRTEVIATIEPDPTVSVSGNTTICEGESAQLTTSAANANSYLWVPGGEQTADITVSPTGQTVYSVTVSNSCGDATDQIAVDVNPLPTISASADQEICEGESVQLSASGIGQLEWSPGGETVESITVAPISTTTYSVSSTNSCGQVSEDVEVVVNPLPNADAGQDQEICEGETATLTASGGGDYTWDDLETTQSIMVSPSSNQTYSVAVSSAENCEASATVSVVVNQLPAQPQISVNGSSLASSPATSYQWYLNGNPIENANDMTFEPLQTGDYSVEIFDENGCSSVSDPYAWIAVGINEFEAGVGIYPNPFDDVISIESRDLIIGVEVMDSRGRLITQIQPNRSSFVLSTADWATGVYHIRLSGEERTSFHRLMKMD